MFGARYLPPLLGTLALGACAVAPPTGPDVLAVPPEGKNLAQFQQEDTSCRGYAQQQIGYGAPQQAANQNAVGSAVAGTALGAAAGALLGAAVGGAGVGAAAGAGTGLLLGSAVGADAATASGVGLQRRYDAAYAQCMAASGDRLQALPAGWPYGPYYGYGYGYYPYPGYYAPWYGPSVTFGFFGRFGPGFRHRGFVHRGFRRW
jgi:Glycine-zipper domain